MKKVYYFILLTIGWCSNSFAVQNCNNQTPSSTPTTQFIVNENRVVVDTHTALMWKRCPEGYTFSDNSTPMNTDDDACTENGIDPKLFSWQEALQKAVTVNNNGGFAAYTDWRVPNVKELSSIVEIQCAYPAINSFIFPGALTGMYWTSSTSASSGYNSWVTDFDLGVSTTQGKTVIQPLHLRLVRDFQ